MPNGQPVNREVSRSIKRARTLADILADAKYTPMNNGKMQLSVGECKIIGTIDKHHIYPVKGFDSNGEFTCERRFSSFLDLR